MSNNYEKNPNEIGAGWKKEGKNGPYVSLSLDINGETVNCNIFKIQYKQPKQANWPDYRVLSFNDNPQQTQRRSNPPSNYNRQQTQRPPQQQRENVDF